MARVRQGFSEPLSGRAQSSMKPRAIAAHGQGLEPPPSESPSQLCEHCRRVEEGTEDPAKPLPDGRNRRYPYIAPYREHGYMHNYQGVAGGDGLAAAQRRLVHSKQRVVASPFAAVSRFSRARQHIATPPTAPPASLATACCMAMAGGGSNGASGWSSCRSVGPCDATRSATCSLHQRARASHREGCLARPFWLSIAHHSTS